MAECPDCGREFESERGMKIHRGQMHDPGVEKECSTCGDEFKVQEWRSESARFCSVQCRADWQSDSYRGSGAPNYRGGKAMLYNGTIQKGEWLKIAEKARAKDNHNCADCGMETDEHWDRYGESLTVHHKIPPREFENDGDPHNFENLVTLCVSCHSDRHHAPTN